MIEEEEKKIFSLKLDTIYLKAKLLSNSHNDEDQTIHLDIAECSLLFFFSIEVFAFSLNIIFIVLG